MSAACFDARRVWREEIEFGRDMRMGNRFDRVLMLRLRLVLFSVHCLLVAFSAQDDTFVFCYFASIACDCLLAFALLCSLLCFALLRLRLAFALLQDSKLRGKSMPFIFLSVILA